jgi:Glyoxalase/Bleomycin resistance protein/Dioxygenase superfamily
VSIDPARAAARPAGGLFATPRPVDALADLFANVWQFGYVTTDLDRAIDFMAGRFGLTHCLKLPAGGTFLAGTEPAEFEAKFAMGARGGTIIELIEPVSGEIDFYTRVLPADGEFAVRLRALARDLPVAARGHRLLHGHRRR